MYSSWTLVFSRADQGIAETQWMLHLIVEAVALGYINWGLQAPVYYTSSLATTALMALENVAKATLNYKLGVLTWIDGLFANW